MRPMHVDSTTEHLSHFPVGQASVLLQTGLSKIPLVSALNWPSSDHQPEKSWSAGHSQFQGPFRWCGMQVASAGHWLSAGHWKSSTSIERSQICAFDDVQTSLNTFAVWGFPAQNCLMNSIGWPLVSLKSEGEQHNLTSSLPWRHTFWYLRNEMLWFIIRVSTRIYFGRLRGVEIFFWAVHIFCQKVSRKTFRSQIFRVSRRSWAIFERRRLFAPWPKWQNFRNFHL